MRARSFVPAVVAALALVGLTGCGNGGGLRVEGADPAGSPASAGPGRSPAPAERTPSPKVLRTAPVDLAAVRVRLLADRQLDQYARSVLSKCTVIERCLSRGPAVDVTRSGRPQHVVYIHTLEKFVFGIFLMAGEAGGPRRIWSLEADQPSVTVTSAGELVIESKIFAIDDKPCCPSGSRVEVYRWNGRQMAKVSSQEQEGD